MLETLAFSLPFGRGRYAFYRSGHNVILVLVVGKEMIPDMLTRRPKP
jgi:hypothetical protein